MHALADPADDTVRKAVRRARRAPVDRSADLLPGATGVAAATVVGLPERRP